MKTLEQLSKSLHLSQYETRIYVAALELGSAALSDLAQAAGVARTAAYPPVRTLLARGLLSQTTVKRRIKYQAVKPESLLAVHDRERLALTEAIAGLTHSLTMPSQGMSVRFFPGQHGLDQAADIFLDQSQTKLWKSIEHADFMLTKVGEARFDDYIQRRVKKGIRARVILPAHEPSMWMRKRVARLESDLTEIIFVSPDEYPIEASIAIDGDTVQFLNARGIPSGTLVTNGPIARTLESMHDMIWDRYKR